MIVIIVSLFILLGITRKLNQFKFLREVTLVQVYIINHQSKKKKSVYN